jgi:hypothetical protein
MYFNFKASLSLTIICLTIFANHCSASNKRSLSVGARKIASLPKGFVPPPPPYEPSSLPEIQNWKSIRIRREPLARESKPKNEIARPEATNPYSRFIYNRDGYQSPQPVQPNKYVTYWSKT